MITRKSGQFSASRSEVFLKISILIVFLLLAVNATPALAYIDPGSGSAIMSAVIGFFVAIAMAVKTYWYKIKSIFTGKKAENQDENKKD